MRRRPSPWESKRIAANTNGLSSSRWRRLALSELCRFMSRKNSTPLEADATSILLLLLIFSASVSDSVGEDLLGVCYGELGYDLPPISTTIKLLKELHADAVRLYDANPSVLTGLRGTGLGVIISMLDSELKDVGQNPSTADSWVKKYVSPFYPSTRITYVVVGNEILSPDTVDEFGPYLVPAMWNVYYALADRGLQDHIKVVAPLSGDILGTSWPPSEGAFIQLNYVYPLLQFLEYTKSKFFINFHPYYAHRMNPVQVPLDYAVFSKTEPEFVDRYTGLPYYNLFDAMIDATYSAMVDIGINKVGVAVGETGWPTAGGYGASARTVQLYIRNLIQHIQRAGTPNRPKERVPVFLFSLYNENEKIVAETERNWGMFHPNATKVYDVDFDTVNSDL
ncbi:hypothetical protein Mapa_003171 [Marchantia paleacea]|nr:hypothetical protein Mapa_003171 [Marchantia paleacea]